MKSWIVTDFALATRALTEFETFTAERMRDLEPRVAPERRGDLQQLMYWLNHWMLFRDPPQHSELRRRLSAILNPKVFLNLSGHVSSVIDHQFAAIERAAPVEFVSKFAHPMPGYVVMDILGVPRDRLLETKGYSNDMMLFIGGSRNADDKYQRARAGAEAIADIFRDAIARRRRGRDGNDVLGLLINSEVDGRKMSEDEIVGTMMMLLNGAHDTTANAISNTVMLLAAHPGIAQRLRQHPAQQTTAIEEMLRYEGPILSVGRLAGKDTELGGKKIEAGNRIYVMLVAANRDPSIFEAPDELRIDRSPNPHMAFGKGQHFCLGAPLAKLEVQLTVKHLLQRFERIEINTPPEDMQWHDSLVARGPMAMSITLQ
ncbi:cytochrome P450 [Chelatococcus reniformis]|nr:cytochrome P450 [Chelatococcus reniformis]